MTSDARETIDGFLSTRKPDLELLVEITTRLQTVNSVHCCVFLPRLFQDKPRLLLLPTHDQAIALHYPPFKLHAETGQNALHSEEVHVLASQSTSWSSGIRSERILCEPWHFDFVSIIEKPIELAHPALEAQRLKLLLTPSQLLTPFMTSHLHSNGSIDAEKVTSSRFRLPGGLEVDFESEVTSEETTNCRILIDQLVGNIDGADLHKDIAATILEAEDMLLLASLAERHRCQCVGWELHSPEIRKRHYFSNRSLQNNPDSENRFEQNPLIDQRHFSGFMEASLGSFAKFNDKTALRRAINGHLHGIGAGVEDRLLTLFASIETIITAYRKERNLEYVVDAERWKQLKDSIRKCIKHSEEPKLGEEQRKRLYGNMAGLNRVAFGEALGEFVAEFSLDVADLWPIVGKSSIAELRNRIIHGDTFSHSEMATIVTAKMHLQWHLERMLLAILRWRQEDSGASERCLQLWSAYRDPVSLLAEHS